MRQLKLLSFLILITWNANGQSPPAKQVIHRNVLWLTLNSSFRFQKNWGILADVSHRRSDFAKENDLSLVRVAGAYWIRPNLFVAAGYAHLWNSVKIGNEEILLDENRLYQQMNLVVKWKKNFLTHRLRLEERWRETSVSGLPSGRFDYTTRYRYLLGFRRPLGGQSSSPSLVLADEIMLQSGKNVQRGIFEQNRIFGGLQLRFSKALSLETGYMYTWQKSLSGLVYNSIHTIRMTLSFEWVQKKHESSPFHPSIAPHH